jgi:hypothetical protein
MSALPFWRVFFVSGVLAGLAPCASAVASPSLTIDQYRAALSRARSAAVAALQETGASAVSAAAARARSRSTLPLQAEVSLPSTVVSVDNRPLGETLSRALGESRPAARRAGLRRFIAALDQLLAATGGQARGTDRSRVDQVLREVLSRPEYRSREPGPSWVDRFLAWLDRLLERWLPQSSASGAPSGRGLGRVLVAVVVLLLAVLIARIIIIVLPDLRASRRRSVDQPSGDLLVPQEPEALLAEAEREAAAGHYREALRLTYRAMVARLEKAGVLPEDRSRTHWELLRDLRRGMSNELRVTSDEESQRPLSSDSSLITHHSSLVSLLSPLTRRLDERLYGSRAATVDDYQECRRVHDQVERLLCAPA